jgi:hypothetical protein
MIRLALMISILTLFIGCKSTQLPDGAISLFNGKNLDGWVIYGTEKWYVDKGELVCESGPDAKYGYLGTEKTFKNFDLSVQFKQESNGNSGLFFRSSIEGTKITGWQAEIAPPDLHTGGIYESYGRGWLIQPDAAELASVFLPNEWNTLRVKAVDDVVTTWVNGKQMIQLKDDKIGKATGQIALQIHDGGNVKVRWKDIILKPL